MAKKEEPKKGGRGKIHLHPKHNTAGFDKNPQNINKKGPISIKYHIKRLMSQDAPLVVPSSQVLEVREDGSVVIEMPNLEKAAMKVIQWAMSNKTKGADVLLKLLEHIDGKAPQPIHVKDVDPNDFSGYTLEELEEMNNQIKAELGQTED